MVSSFEVKDIYEDLVADATSVIVPGGSFRMQKRVNALVRASSRRKATFTSCGVFGNTGYVFNDFQNDFEVIDVDGEQEREVCRPIISNI